MRQCADAHFLSLTTALFSTMSTFYLRFSVICISQLVGIAGSYTKEHILRRRCARRHLFSNLSRFVIHQRYHHVHILYVMHK
jgi:hypothetical protein